MCSSHANRRQQRERRCSWKFGAVLRCHESHHGFLKTGGRQPNIISYSWLDSSHHGPLIFELGASSTMGKRSLDVSAKLDVHGRMQMIFHHRPYTIVRAFRRPTTLAWVCKCGHCLSANCAVSLLRSSIAIVLCGEMINQEMARHRLDRGDGDGTRVRSECGCPGR